MNLTVTCNSERQWENQGVLVEVFECEQMRCPQPPNIANAVLNSGNVDIFIVNSTATYKCLEGYKRIGSQPLLVCTHDAEWSLSLFECLKIDCGKPPPVANARVTTENGTGEGAVAVYTCESGFTMTSNSNSRSCGVDNLWIKEFIECLDSNLKHCGEPPGVEFASVSVHSVQTGQVAVYDCQDGYSHAWSSTMECSHIFMSWVASPVVKCVPVDCGKPPELENAQAIYTNTTFGSIVFYRCENRLESGVQNATCSSKGTWILEAPVECLPYETQTCGSPPQVSNSVRAYLSTTVGSVANYNCDYGFYGPLFEAQCEDNGVWNLQEPYECLPLECGPELLVNHVESIHTSGRAYGDVAVYSCMAGFTHTGPSLKTCQANQKWSSDIVECAPENFNFCADPPRLDRATVVFTSRAVGAVAEYTCLAGYTGRAAASSCGHDGEWTEPDLVCEVTYCETPAPIGNAVIVPGGEKVPYGGSVIYVCVEGSTSSTQTPLMSTCLENSSWSPINGSCEPVVLDLSGHCNNEPHQVPNARMVFLSGTHVGAIVHFLCDIGYYPVPPDEVFFQVCFSDRMWSTKPLVCMSSLCLTETPPQIANADFIGLEYEQGVADTVAGMYKCSLGYSREGNVSPTNVTSNPVKSARCHYSLGWSIAEAIDCSPVDCGPLVPSEGIQVVRWKDQTVYTSLKIIAF